MDVGGSPYPTAFVEVDPSGRELDVHVVRCEAAHAPTVVCDVPWQLNHGSLNAVGVIAGLPVVCVPAATQIQMHSGYDLPDAHVRDLLLLRGLVGPAAK